MSDINCIYKYPGTDIFYMASGSGRFGYRVDEDNYFTYVLKYLREKEDFKNVLAIEKMKLYETADGREAYISRLEITESDGSIEVQRDADLLIFPAQKCFVMFEVAHYPDDTVPLDIREVVDTATFEFGPENVVEGSSFYEEDRDCLLEFTDSENFVTYLDPDNKDILYAYGTYSVYVGEDAIQQVSGMDEYGLSREDIMFGITNMDQSYTSEHFMALVFDIKGSVDEAGNDSESEASVLYIGIHDDEFSTMDVINCNSLRFYHFERVEDEEK